MKKFIDFCSGCTMRSEVDSKKSTFELKKEFKSKLYLILKTEHPEIEWDIDSVPCMKICPEGRVSLAVENRLTMSQGTTPEQVARDILKQISF